MKTAKKPAPLERTSKKPAVAKCATVLVLRTCNADMRSASERAKGFQWPTSGPVKAPDWSAEPVCGHGLHGLLWGEGAGSLLDWSETAKWLVVEVVAADIVELAGKVKFPRGNVVCCGAAFEATNYIAARSVNRAIVGGTATTGYRGKATAGYRGTATAGVEGVATAGDEGVATAGDGGTATAGDGGVATAGDGGTATAGRRGTATAGCRGVATAGDGGTATAGDEGTATAGCRGEIRIRWYDDKTGRFRCAVGYVGESGIDAGVAYVVSEGKLVKAGAK